MRWDTKVCWLVGLLLEATFADGQVEVGKVRAAQVIEIIAGLGLSPK